MDELNQLRKKVSDLEQNERLFKETQKKLQAANQQLQANDQQLKSSLETLVRTQRIAHVGSWDWDVESDTVSWSDELFQIFRLNPENGAVSYADHPKIYTPESMQLLNAAVRNALETGEPYEIDLEIIRGDGTNAFCTARGLAKKDEKGKVIQLFGSFQDITERKNAEEELKKSEERLKIVIDNNPFPIAVVDEKDQNIKFWSKSAIQLFGHDPKTTKEWYELAYPDPEYRQEFIERWKPFLETAQNSTKAVHTGEYKICCKNGSVKICELYAQFIPGNLIVTLNDITERKKSEEYLKALNQQLQANEQQLRAANQELRANEQQLRAVNQQFQVSEEELIKNKEKAERYLNVAAEIIISIDKKGCISLLNDSGHQLLGYKKGELIGKNWFTHCLPENSVKEIKGVFKKIMNGQVEKVANYESDIQTKSGDIKTILWHNTILQDELGKINGLLSSGEDITERNKAEDHLKALNQQLVANDQQLRAANQQLMAREQQLIAAVEQLQSNEQQLRAANQQLIASESELMNAKEAAEKSEEKFSTIFNMSSSMICVADINTATFKFLNPAFKKVLGYDEMELLSKPFLDFIHPDDVKPTIDVIEKKLKAGIPQIYFENRYKRKDGNYCYLTWNSFPVPEKGITYAIAHDITEQKKTEISLYQANEELIKVQEITHSGSWYLNTETNEVTWSKELYKMYGFDPNLPVPPYTEHMKLFTPESWEMLSTSLAKTAEKGIPYELELRTVRNDKSNGWMWVRGEALYDENKKIIGLWGAAQDISERKELEIELLKAKEKAEESERALNHSHDLMKYIIEHNRSAVAVHDKNLKYIYVSQRYLEDYKVKEKDVIGKHHYEVFPDLPKKWRDVHKKALLGEILSAEDDPYYKDDGSVEWTRWECRPWYEKDNTIGGFIVYTEVITERKKMELALREAKEKAEESEEKIRQIFDNSTTVHYAHDLDHVVNYVSPQVKNILGYTPEELKVKWTSLASDNPINKEALKNTLRAIETGKKQAAYQIEFVHKNGKKVLVEAHEAPVVRDGKTISIVGSFADITERNKLEKIKDILVAISNKILTTINLEEFFHHIFMELSNIVETNNFYIALYDEQSEMISTPYIADKLDTDITDFPAKRTITGHVIKTRKSIFVNQADFRELVKSGTIDLVGPPSDVWIGVPLFSGENVIGAIVIQNYEGEKRLGEEDLRVLEYVAPQISLAIERKKNVEDLKHALEKAQEADRLKSAFLANMSHEIRTPMNGILGFTDLLKEPQLTGPERKKYIQIIENSGQRLLSTVNDLIDISKIESGQMMVSISEFDIDQLNDDLFTFFNVEAKKKNLQLFLSRSSLSNNVILGDKEKTYSILSNLIKNAIKYTRSGSIEFGCQEKGNKLQFFVKDSGNGIPKDRLDAIFDRFIRNDNDDAIFTEGSGLGLSISKAYVEMLGGKIWVESELGVGSQFYFTIPYKTVKSKISETINVNSKSTEQINPEISGLKILIAEDDQTAAQLLSILVKQISEEIIITKSGIETIELCRKNPDIDVILMDIQMPKMNGYEATKLIREFNKDVIIIAQTAFALSGDQEKSMEAGCNDYISKPINKTKLLEKIEKCISRR